MVGKIVFKRIFITVLIVIIGLEFFVPAIVNLVITDPQPDHVIHGRLTTRLFETNSLIFDGTAIANPLFHLITAGLMKLFPINVQLATIIVLVAVFILTGFVIDNTIYRFHEKYNILVCTIIGLSILFYSPIYINPMIDWLTPFSYIPVITFHNPTIWFARLCSLGLFLYFIRFSDGGMSGWKHIGILAILSASSILAKPNFGIVFLPALCIYLFVLIFKKEPLPWRGYILGIYLPMILILTWQFWLRYQLPQNLGIEIRPFLVMRHLSSSTPVSVGFLLSILFPLSILIMNFQTAIRNRWVVFSWAILFISYSYYVLFAETQPSTFDGNFLWGPIMALLNLVVISTMFWLTQSKANKILHVNFAVPFGILILHGLSGMGYAIFRAVV